MQSNNINPASSSEGQGGSQSGPSYLKKLSHSLRTQQRMAGPPPPITMTNPTFEEQAVGSITLNPTRDMYRMQQPVVKQPAVQQPPSTAIAGVMGPQTVQPGSPLDHTTLKVHPDRVHSDRYSSPADSNLGISYLPSGSIIGAQTAQLPPAAHFACQGSQSTLLGPGQQPAGSFSARAPLRQGQQPAASFNAGWAPVQGQQPAGSLIVGGAVGQGQQPGSLTAGGHPGSRSPFEPLAGGLPDISRQWGSFSSAAPPRIATNVGFVQPGPPFQGPLTGQSQSMNPHWRNDGVKDVHKYDGPDQDPPELRQQRKHERRGTQSGPYHGFASQQWMQVEMQKEVDDVVKNVNITVTQREHKTFAMERAALRKEVENLLSQKMQLLEKIAKLELMMPDENGEFVNLKRELDELEDDCDFYYKLYQGAAAAKQADEARIEHLNTRIMDMEEKLAHVREGLDPQSPNSMVSEVPVPFVTPEMVLAAEAAVGRPPQRWPDKYGILIRVLLVSIFLMFIGGAILCTYFLTKHYS